MRKSLKPLILFISLHLREYLSLSEIVFPPMNLLPVWPDQHKSSRRAGLLCDFTCNPELTPGGKWDSHVKLRSVTCLTRDSSVYLESASEVLPSIHLQQILCITIRFAVPPLFCFLNDGYFKIYLLIYVWLPWITMAAHQLFRVAVHGLVLAVASLVVEHRLRMHRLQQLWHVDSRACAVWCTGLVALRHMESSWTRDQMHVPCIGRQILYHWTTREVQLDSLCYFVPQWTLNTSLVDPCRNISSSPQFLAGLGKSCHIHTPQSEKWVTHLKQPDLVQFRART